MRQRRQHAARRRARLRGAAAAPHLHCRVHPARRHGGALAVGLCVALVRIVAPGVGGGGGGQGSVKRRCVGGRRGCGGADPPARVWTAPAAPEGEHKADEEDKGLVGERVAPHRARVDAGQQQRQREHAAEERRRERARQRAAVHAAQQRQAPQRLAVNDHAGVTNARCWLAELAEGGARARGCSCSCLPQASTGACPARPAAGLLPLHYCGCQPLMRLPPAAARGVRGVRLASSRRRLLLAAQLLHAWLCTIETLLSRSVRRQLLLFAGRQARECHLLLLRRPAVPAAASKLSCTHQLAVHTATSNCSRFAALLGRNSSKHMGLCRCQGRPSCDPSHAVCPFLCRCLVSYVTKRQHRAKWRCLCTASGDAQPGAAPVAPGGSWGCVRCSRRLWRRHGPIWTTSSSSTRCGQR